MDWTQEHIEEMARNHPMEMLIAMAQKIEALEATVAELVEARVA